MSTHDTLLLVWVAGAGLIAFITSYPNHQPLWHLLASAALVAAFALVVAVLTRGAP